MENVIMCVRMDWLKDGRLKIKLTNFGIGKYVQECMYDIWLCWGWYDEKEVARKKEGKNKERKK